MYRRITAFVFVAVLAVAGAAGVQAQATDTPDATVQVGWWKQHMGSQLAVSLRSPVASIRQQALQHVNYFAANARGEVDLSATVPALTEIYEADGHEGMRIMALTALHAIGGDAIMRYLRETVQDETSLRIRQLTLAALSTQGAEAL